MRFVRVALVALAAAIASSTLASASPAGTAPFVVRATIWPNLAITVSPKSFAHGTVLFKIKNRDTKPHEFSINGVQSAKIRPHKIVTMTVTFRKPSTYSFNLPDYQPTPDSEWAAVGGQVKVT